MEELLEMVTWSQLGIHGKPVRWMYRCILYWFPITPLWSPLNLEPGVSYFLQVGLLNVDGYFNSLIELFDKGVEEGFIVDSERHIIVSADTAEELMKKMEVNEMIILFLKHWIPGPFLIQGLNKSFQGKVGLILSCFWAANLQEYAPVHDAVTSRRSWEEEQSSGIITYGRAQWLQNISYYHAILIYEDSWCCFVHFQLPFRISFLFSKITKKQNMVSFSKM